jgi:hypothetical protein
LTETGPGTAGILQSTTFAETVGPPIAMKWITYGLASLVVQLRVKVAASQDCRSASASTTSPHWTTVRALSAMRWLAFEGLTASWLAIAAERLVVPSVIPKPWRKPALKLSSVLPFVHRMRALGVWPRPWRTAWLTGATPVDFVNEPTLTVCAPAPVAKARRRRTPAGGGTRARRPNFSRPRESAIEPSGYRRAGIVPGRKSSGFIAERSGGGTFWPIPGRRPGRGRECRS